MTPPTRHAPDLKKNSHRRHAPGESTADEAAAEGDDLSLPIEPDEGTALIPDDERVFNVPS